METTKVTLTVLAKDVPETDYLNANDCAITRALKRAGVDAVHAGDCLMHEIVPNGLPHTFNLEEFNFQNDDAEIFRKFSETVENMYRQSSLHLVGKNKLLPKDISIRIHVPIKWITLPKG